MSRKVRVGSIRGKVSDEGVCEGVNMVSEEGSPFSWRRRSSKGGISIEI